MKGVAWMRCCEVSVPFTREELEGMGVVFSNIEEFVHVPQDLQLGHGACELGPNDNIHCECCDDGWGGDVAGLCDICGDMSLCAPTEDVHAVMDALLAHAPGDVASGSGAILRTRQFVYDVLLADAVVIAQPSAKSDTMDALSDGTPQLRTHVDLAVDEVIRGTAGLTEVSFAYWGPKDHDPLLSPSNAPIVPDGIPRLYAIRYRAAGPNTIVSDTGSWRVTNGEIDLGFYRFTPAQLVDALDNI
jgi:hypothetical protein